MKAARRQRSRSVSNIIIDSCKKLFNLSFILGKPFKKKERRKRRDGGRQRKIDIQLLKDDDDDDDEFCEGW